MAALYHERWEIEGALAELKTQLRGARVVLRSKTPELVEQEVWGLLLAHFAVRGLMHEAALQADEDPDRLSFLHAVRVVRRKLPQFAALPPSGQAPCMGRCWTRFWRSVWQCSRGRQVPRGVKRKMSGYPLRPRTPLPTVRIDFTAAIKIAK